MPKLLTSEESLKTFLANCQQREYPKNEDIVRPGDPADTLYFVVKGSLVVTLEEESGQELILAYLNPGEFLGEVGLFVSQSTRNVLIKTRTETTLAEISYAKVVELVEEGSYQSAKALLIAIGIQLSNRLLHTSRKAGMLAFYDVTGRIARTLLELCEEPDAMTHPDGMQIQITRQELGKIVSCSREMAGRILANLEREGLIAVEGKKTIIVHNAERPTYKPLKKSGD
ncbi:MAG: cAMP-activated global transcriptional regulator CRP [Gammaproteobacteria bacterium]|nr:cAMP-activated global transcriptional regulator CRP [Gammaproteobacteria bacterium]